MFLRTESDAELVARSRKGDVEAFNHLVSRWEKRLYNYLLRLMAGRPGYREDALDLAQEAFLKAYQSLGTLTDAAKFSAWLYRIGHNLAFSHLRTQLGRPMAVELSENDGQRERPSGWTTGRTNDWYDIGSGWAADSRRTTAQPAFGREMEIAVARALESLPPEQREAIVLKVYHGFLFEEIAEITSSPVSTVKTRVYAGFSQLRVVLESEPAAPSKRFTRR